MNDLRKTTGPMRQALKAAVRRALLLAGGGDSVQYATRVKSPALSRYASSQEEHQDNHCPIDVATDLDLEAGQPVILETMARAQGYRLERIEPAQYAEIPWPQKQGMISRTVGELAGIIGDALADGRIDRDEANAAREKIREQIQQLQRLDARIEAEACDGPVVRMTGVAR